MTARGRSVSILLLVLAGGVLVLAATQPWIRVTLSGTAEPLAVSGADALPVLMPLSLSVLALAGVLALVGRALRYVLAAVAVANGVWLLLGVLPLVGQPPISAVARAVTEKTGIAGADAVSALVAETSGTGWISAGLVASLVIVCAGVFVAASAHRWKTGGRRFRTETSSGSGPVDAIDSWDDLSRGADPTAEDR